MSHLHFNLGLMNVKPGCKLITGTGRGCPGVEGEDTRHPPQAPRVIVFRGRLIYRPR